VLGGGILREDRRLRLVLHMPAYHLAVQVRNRLNSRFGAQVPVADAVSPDTIQLTIPPEFRRRERAFLELVMHTCLNGNPGFLQRRAAELAEEILHPDALYEDVSLAWEAIGRTIIPTLRPLYAQPNLAASYYAARAGLRLGDPDAVDPLARCAAQKTHPFRELAVEELGRASDSRRAADALRERLADPDPRIRLKAYEGLVRHRHESLRVTRVGDHFVLDEVDCPGETVVHLTTSDEPRIAILGTDPRLRTPLTYHVPRLITLSADAGDPHVRAVRVNPRTKVASPQLEAPLKLADFIRFLGDKPVPQSDGAVRGLGLDYAACVAVLHRLSQDGALGANLVIQRPSVSEQLWKLKTRERPESEL
jgi:hypothetical protein